jgi:2-hydroxy-3-keto-5-methylthiopentenyl-1-phosphate phosphatase
MNNNVKIFSDFDGTITKGDVGNLIFKTFPGEQIWSLIKLWKSNKITSRDLLTRECEMADITSLKKLNDLIDGQSIDDHFESFVNFCNNNEIKIYILSDGLDYYIKKILDKYNFNNLTFFANRFDYRSLEDNKIKIIPDFPYTDSECDKCGNCKRNHLLYYTNEEEIVIYIGDGYSDRCPIEYADIVFAKGSLLAYCIGNNIPCIEFKDFSDILRNLQEITSRKKINKKRTAELKRKEILLQG